MTLTNITQSMQLSRLDRTLEYAVIQNWDELMPTSAFGVMRVEYETGADGTLDFFRIWASTIRGRWTRVCEYWAKPLWGHDAGLVLSENYGSIAFARTLNLVMGNEAAFVQLPDHLGSFQIYAPTEAERSQAKRWMDVAFNREAAAPPLMFAPVPASFAENRGSR